MLLKPKSYKPYFKKLNSGEHLESDNDTVLEEFFIPDVDVVSLFNYENYNINHYLCVNSVT